MTEPHDELPTFRIAASDLDPASADVEIVETHISTLVLAGDVVHKRKKHLRLPFIDLSTAVLREQICRREVVLNRRFSPDVYLGVEEIVDDAGQVVDHAVLMRRMPDDRRLATLIGQHDDVSACLTAVARTIAVCHADSPRSAAISATATPDALRQLWQHNLDEMADLRTGVVEPAELDAIEYLAHRYLDGRTSLLERRIRDGWIVDGHGDLIADDVFCLDDGPRILDCLEFDDGLRWGDVLLDIGFLAMDLEHIGRPDLAAAFLDDYGEFSGETHCASLAHHYMAYRALVRAKVSLLKGRSHDHAARSYLDQCRAHLLEGRVHVIVVGGLPGTGKSTLATAIGDQLGFVVLRSDETRKELAGLSAQDSRPSAYGHGLYSAEMTEATYEMLLDRARSLLARGESVIFDASFSAERWRAAAAALAEEGRARYTPLRCTVPSEIAHDRIRRRAAAGDDASDATAQIADGMAERFEVWNDATTVDMMPPVADVVPAVVSTIRGSSDPGTQMSEERER